MPSLRNHRVIELIRGLKLFSNFELGLTRGKAPEPDFNDKGFEQQARTIQRLRRQLTERDQRISRLEASSSETESAAALPENLIWLFGTGRSGTTWLGSMMGDIAGHPVWFEPRLGDLFDASWPGRHGGDQFIFGPRYEETWLGSIRGFVLDGAAARFPWSSETGEHLVVKETSGCVGAPLLMDALPESRMVLLARDPRDVVASWLDGLREGGWRDRQTQRLRGERALPPDSDPDTVASNLAERYVRNIEAAKRAYDEHQGYKALVRYEDLTTDVSRSLRSLYYELEIPVEDGDLARVSGERSWNNIPEDKKGEGEFHRRGSPGGWKKDLTPRQVEIVERVTAPLLREFYQD